MVRQLPAVQKGLNPLKGVQKEVLQLLRRWKALKLWCMISSPRSFKISAESCHVSVRIESVIAALEIWFSTFIMLLNIILELPLPLTSNIGRLETFSLFPLSTGLTVPLPSSILVAMVLFLAPSVCNITSTSSFWIIDLCPSRRNAGPIDRSGHSNRCACYNWCFPIDFGETHSNMATFERAWGC